MSFVDSLEECLELLTIKRNRLVVFPVADENPWLSDIFDSEGFAGQRGQEDGIRGDLFNGLEKRVPIRTERQLRPMRQVGNSPRAKLVVAAPAESDSLSN